MTTAEAECVAGMERLRLAGELDALGLLVLADHYEDIGDAEMAAFCRYMPESPRIPAPLFDGCCRWWNEHQEYPPSQLPYLIWVRALGRYRSREEAERDLGRSLLDIGTRNA